MFCQSCGNNLPDNVKFCPSCGCATNVAPCVSAPKRTPQNAITPRKTDGFSALTIVVSLVILMAGLFLPLFELTYDRSTYTLSLFGDNYMANFGVREDILSTIGMSFVFSIAAIVAVNVYSILRKPLLQLVFAIINVIIIGICQSSVVSMWGNESNNYHTSQTTALSGMSLFIIGSIILVILALIAFFRAQKEPKQSEDGFVP